MAKGKARGAESFENELYIHELAASLLEVSGFVDAQATKMNHMKFIDAKRDDGKVFRFWLKQGWSDHPDYSAVQFHLFQGRTGETIPDKEFLDVVRRIVDKAKNADASHALLVQKMGMSYAIGSSYPSMRSMRRTRNSWKNGQLAHATPKRQPSGFSISEICQTHRVPERCRSERYRYATWRLRSRRTRIKALHHQRTVMHSPCARPSLAYCNADSEIVWVTHVDGSAPFPAAR